MIHTVRLYELFICYTLCGLGVLFVLLVRIKFSNEGIVNPTFSLPPSLKLYIEIIEVMKGKKKRLSF